MSGLKSKNKGKRGEREIVNVLKPILEEVVAKFQDEGYECGDMKLFRNQNQSFEGGYDIGGLDWLAIEVKFQEQLNVNGWWKQTKAQTGPGQEPVLFYRRSRMKWKVMTELRILCGKVVVRSPVEMQLEDYLVYFKSRLEEELRKRDFE
ncbi:MAG: hypothetical protein K0U41_02385 [Gammaproteobacteria bacterium]|nr:hypothetical protein [Gammaproteobacteria bacterium]